MAGTRPICATKLVQARLPGVRSLAVAVATSQIAGIVQHQHCIPLLQTWRGLDESLAWVSTLMSMLTALEVWPRAWAPSANHARRSPHALYLNRGFGSLAVFRACAGNLSAQQAKLPGLCRTNTAFPCCRRVQASMRAWGGQATGTPQPCCPQSLRRNSIGATNQVAGTVHCIPVLQMCPGLDESPADARVASTGPQDGPGF